MYTFKRGGRDGLFVSTHRDEFSECCSGHEGQKILNALADYFEMADKQ